MKEKINKYINIITDFLNEVITVQEFEISYLKMVKNDTFIFEDNIAKVIGTLFSDLDAYCGDPEIANYDVDDPLGDIDEDELRKRADYALKELKYDIQNT